MAATADMQACRSGGVDDLVRLYEREGELYREVLRLSKDQTSMIRRGEGLDAVRRVLVEKRGWLDEISRLEREHASQRRAWTGRSREEDGGAPTALPRALQAVGTLIEEILMVEAENDRLFLEMTRS